MPERVAGLVLAAGAGRRFGGPKALVRYADQLLVERAVTALTQGGCRPVLVVLGASAEHVVEVADLGIAETVFNADWPSGMGSSLRTGLDTLEGDRARSDVAGVVVMPVDMPGITAEAVRRLADRANPDTLAAASYAGSRGHPVLLGRHHWAGVRAAATGDRGARGYLRDQEVNLVACDDVAAGFDIDRPEDLDGG